jgi:hypothetical protein
MFGIPLVLIFGLLAWFSWRRGHRHGLVLMWGILFGVFLGGSAAAVVHTIAASGASGLEAGVRGAMGGVAGTFR